MANDYYPGQLINWQLGQLFGQRAAEPTIRQWRNGRRPAPAWAFEVLRQAIAKKERAK
jgi:hypothetical protein